MKDSLLDFNILHQQTILGELKLYLHPKESIMLKLIYAPKEEMLQLWSELWDGIGDYDNLPAGCRTLMASVVNKLQRMGFEEDWKRVHGLNLTFLSGITRFVWTKNKFMLSQMLRIAEHVGRSGIEIVAIKGMAELLLDTEMGLMRSTSDLDLLIKPKDFDIFSQKMSELGYRQIETSEEFLVKRSPLPKDQYLFLSNKGYKLEIDVHLMVDKYHLDGHLTEQVWLGKVPSKQCPNLFIPSPRDRFLISLVNVFRITNWYPGSYLKYINDALYAINKMTQKEDSNQLLIGIETLNYQDWLQQILQVGQNIRLFNEQIAEAYSLNHVSDSYANSKLQRFSINFLKKGIFSKLTRMLSQKNNFKLLYILNRYSLLWQYKVKQLGSIKAIKFLFIYTFTSIIFFILRKILTIFNWKKKIIDVENPLAKTPISNIKWT